MIKRIFLISLLNLSLVFSPLSFYGKVNLDEMIYNLKFSEETLKQKKAFEFFSDHLKEHSKLIKKALFESDIPAKNRVNILNLNQFSKDRIKGDELWQLLESIQNPSYQFISMIIDLLIQEKDFDEPYKIQNLLKEKNELKYNLIIKKLATLNPPPIKEANDFIVELGRKELPLTIQLELIEVLKNIKPSEDSLPKQTLIHYFEKSPSSIFREKLMTWLGQYPFFIDYAKQKIHENNPVLFQQSLLRILILFGDEPDQIIALEYTSEYYLLTPIMDLFLTYKIKGANVSQKMCSLLEKHHSPFLEIELLLTTLRQLKLSTKKQILKPLFHCLTSDTPLSESSKEIREKLVQQWGKSD